MGIVIQIFNDLFFKAGAPLQDEYNNLYRALFNKPEQYIRIIEALCSVTKGISRDETDIVFGWICC